jgi:hypothetical protein
LAVSEIAFGLIVEGTAEVWVDDVSIVSVTRLGGSPAGPPATGASVPAGQQKSVQDGGFESTFAILGSARTGMAALASARAASATGLEAMIAFTRLAGYVRFFHPSDSVAATDWQQFLVGDCVPWKARRRRTASRAHCARSSAG